MVRNVVRKSRPQCATPVERLTRRRQVCSVCQVSRSTSSKFVRSQIIDRDEWHLDVSHRDVYAVVIGSTEIKPGCKGQNIDPLWFTFRSKPNPNVQVSCVARMSMRGQRVSAYDKELDLMRDE